MTVRAISKLASRFEQKYVVAQDAKAQVHQLSSSLLTKFNKWQDYFDNYKLPSNLSMVYSALIDLLSEVKESSHPQPLFQSNKPLPQLAQSLYDQFNYFALQADAALSDPKANSDTVKALIKEISESAQDFLAIKNIKVA